MVLGMPFRRAPVATCDLIQAVLGSALPEDTVLAEQAQRLKMAVALATSKPSGKEFALKCKELLKADSVGIFAVAHSASQLRNCAPLALLARERIFVVRHADKRAVIAHLEVVRALWLDALDFRVDDVLDV